jgi:hypothetical protein
MCRLIASQLQSSGILPADAAWGRGGPSLAPGVDLLPLMAPAWSNASTIAGSRVDRVRAERMAAWCREQQTCGASLTLGVAGLPCESARQWLGPRLAWWPDGVPAGRRVGMASSRLGRALDARRSWFAALRTACAQIDPNRDVLLTSSATSTARFAERAALLYGLRILRIETEREQTTLANWFRRTCLALVEPANPYVQRAFLSPLIASEPRSPSGSADNQQMPLRDRALIALSEHLVALHLRPGGQLHSLLRARLSDPTWPVASVYVALATDLVRDALAQELLQLGGVGWVLVDAPRVRASRTATRGCPEPLTLGPVHSPAPIVPLPGDEEWSFLSHSTRRQDGPWPDQTEEEYLDQLILDHPDVDHSALASVARIIARRRLVATTLAVRGSTPVVSFTAVPLAQLHRLRVFRSHRGRWDFEPYGICIRRAWLQRRRARPVLYGDDDQWQKLREDDRPFFQRSSTRAREDQQPIDWTVEREWRHVGDVDLQDLPVADGLVFVPSRREAEHLASVSRWPITFLGED